jgi:AraC-like DNA-binding protein
MPTQFWRIPELQNLEILRMTKSSHSFPRHWHETYVIEVVEQGVNDFWCEGKIYSAGHGSILVIQPGEVHTGYPAAESELTYRSLYPSESFMRSLARDIYGKETIPHFVKKVIEDSRFATTLIKAHRLLECSVDRMRGHSLMIMALGQLITRHSGSRFCPIDSNSLIDSKINRAISYLTENYHQNISLSEISTLSGLSEFHFVRTFRRATGLPPYEYLVAIRVEKARKLLSKGMPIVEVAARSGFYDQSHFNRHFKRIYGITPGAYLKA